MAIRQDLLLIRKAREAISPGARPEHNLVRLAEVLRKSLRSSMACVLVLAGHDSIVATAGLHDETRQNLTGITLTDDVAIENSLRTWWTGSLVFRDIDAAGAFVFAGWRTGREILDTDRAKIEIVSQFVEMELLMAKERCDAADRILKDERDRLACELHDGLAQSLYGMALQIKICKRVVNKDIDAAKDRLDRLEELAALQIEDVRGYMRTLKENRSISPDFTTVLKSHARQVCALHNLQLNFNIKGQQVELHPEIRENLYYVVSEALGNIMRHARASGVKISMNFDEEELELSIRDNGRGFDISTLSKRSYANSGMGLENIRKRVQQIGGTVAIQSRKNAGSNIRAVVPFEFDKRSDRDAVGSVS